MYEMNPMTDHVNPENSRRAVLRLLTGAVGTAAGLMLLGRPVRALARPADPDGKAAKSALQYQTRPNGDSMCANCANYIPPKTPDSAGRCTIVAGDIDPEGWCLAYAGNG